MKESILTGKRILAVDDEPDVLTVMEEEILEACPGCMFDKAATYEEAAARMGSWTYDLVILGTMGLRGLDLLELALSRNFVVSILTPQALAEEALKGSMGMRVRAYVPKERLGEIVSLLENIMRQEYFPQWKVLFGRLEGFFNVQWEANWLRPEAKFWCRTCRCRHGFLRSNVY